MPKVISTNQMPRERHPFHGFILKVNPNYADPLRAHTFESIDFTGWRNVQALTTDTWRCTSYDGTTYLVVKTF